MRLRLLWVFLLAVCATAQAAGFDPALFSDLHWRLIGPFRGGRVLAVSGVPGNPAHFYFGSVDGGVWETRDAGRTWQPIFDSQHVGSIGALAIAPSNPDVIYVGSGEADMRSDIGYGNGMYKSADAGKTWTHIGLEDSMQIGKILVDPQDPNLVYVAALGHAYGANEERGVFRSRDGGQTWQKVLYKDADTGAIDLAFGGDGKTIYAALWQTRRPPWNVYPPTNGPGSGLYKSSDGGDSWAQLSGLPTEGLGRIGVAVALSDPNIVFALVDAKEGGLFRSADAGATWTKVSKDKRIWSRGWYFGGLSLDPKDADVVYVNDTAMYKSTDGGKTFLPFRGDPTGDDYHALWIDPTDGARMISGSDQGAMITANGGQTWSSWFNQATGQFYHVITDSRFPYFVYGAQQDSGAAGVPSRSGSPYDGINTSHFREIQAGGESGNIAPDPLDPDIVFGGNVDKFDLKTEQNQDVDPTLAYPDIYRSEWTLPLTFSPRNPHALYFGNQFLFRTTDGGKHWARISKDLTRGFLTVPPNLDALTANDTAVAGQRRAVIYAIAPSRVRDHELWVGTDDGLIWHSRDEGQHWQEVTPAALTPWSKIGILEASHFDANTVYAAVDRHRVDDYKPYIYRTHDGGKSWTEISDGIPDGSFVNVVREDPVRQGLLYAGTEMGMYVSFDDGDHWQPLQQNLPVTSVRDIDVHGDDLVIATHGRAFWIMDDVRPLRQLDERVAAADAALFKPAPAVRLHLQAFTGTLWPKDEPMAANPPAGAMLDYYLKADAQSPLTLDIVDSGGKTVIHFSSTDKYPPPNPAEVSAMPDWLPSPQALLATAGAHRFVWDLHYAEPPELAHAEADAPPESGIWAPPGNYSVKLTVEGKSYEQTLTVTNDPRVKLTQSQLVAQFGLMRQVQAAQLQVEKAVGEAKNLLKQAAALKTSAPLTDQVAAFSAAITKLTELRLVPIPYGTPGSSPLLTSSLAYLNEALDKLQGALQTADAAPTTDAVAGFEKQTKQLKKSLAAWEKFKAQQLPALNAAVQQAGLTPLQP